MQGKKAALNLYSPKRYCKQTGLPSFFVKKCWYKIKKNKYFLNNMYKEEVPSRINYLQILPNIYHLFTVIREVR